MPLNDDPVLGTLVDPKEYPGDSQEDLNAEILMVHDQNLLLSYLKRHLAIPVLDDILVDLRECDDLYWEKVLRRMIVEYFLTPLKMYLTETKIPNFSHHVQMLIKCLKISFMEKILEKIITPDMSRDDLEKIIIEQFESALLIWVIKFIDRESYSRFMIRIFSEYNEPTYFDGDELI